MVSEATPEWPGNRDADRALAALEAAVVDLLDAPRSRRTWDAALDMARRLRVVLDAGELAFSRLAADLETHLDVAASDESLVDVLRHECRMTTSAVRRAVDVGRHQHSLPQSVDALRAGEVGFAHVAELAGVAAYAARSSTGGFDETPLLEQARSRSASRFRYDCADARHALDADRFRDDFGEKVAACSLVLNTHADHVTLGGRFDLVSGAILRTALEPLARPLGQEDRRPRDQRLADAAVELAKHALDTGVVRGRPHVQVTATLQTLQGLPGAPAGRLEHAGAIPAAVVQQFACDAAVQRIVFGPGSVILDAGRERRVVSAAQRRALDARDGGCVYRGCPRSASWTDKHHVEFWGRDGGRTDAATMASLCWVHHGKVHRGEAAVFGTRDGAWITVETPPLWDQLRARPPAGSRRPPPLRN